MSNTDRSYSTYYGPLVEGRNIQAGVTSRGGPFTVSGGGSILVSNTAATIALLEQAAAVDVFNGVTFTFIPTSEPSALLYNNATTIVCNVAGTYQRVSDVWTFQPLFPFATRNYLTSNGSGSGSATIFIPYSDLSGLHTASGLSEVGTAGPFKATYTMQTRNGSTYAADISNIYFKVIPDVGVTASITTSTADGSNIAIAGSQVTVDSGRSCDILATVTGTYRGISGTLFYGASQANTLVSGLPPITYRFPGAYVPSHGASTSVKYALTTEYSTHILKNAGYVSNERTMIVRDPVVASIQVTGPSTAYTGSVYDISAEIRLANGNPVILGNFTGSDLSGQWFDNGVLVPAEFTLGLYNTILCYEPMDTIAHTLTYRLRNRGVDISGSSTWTAVNFVQPDSNVSVTISAGSTDSGNNSLQYTAGPNSVIVLDSGLGLSLTSLRFGTFIPVQGYFTVAGQRLADSTSLAYSLSTLGAAYNTTRDISYALVTQNATYYSNKISVSIRDPVVASTLVTGPSTVYVNTVYDISAEIRLANGNPVILGNFTGSDLSGQWFDNGVLVPAEFTLGLYNTILCYEPMDTIAHTLSYRLRNRGVDISGSRIWTAVNSVQPDTNVSVTISAGLTDSSGNPLRYTDITKSVIVLDSGLGLNLTASRDGTFIPVQGYFTVAGQPIPDSTSLAYSSSTQGATYGTFRDISYALVTQNATYYSNKITVSIQDQIPTSIDVSATNVTLNSPTTFTATIRAANPVVAGNFTRSTTGTWTIDGRDFINTDYATTSGIYNTILSYTLPDTQPHTLRYTLRNDGIDTTGVITVTASSVVPPDSNVQVVISSAQRDSGGNALHYGQTGGIILDSGLTLDISANFAGTFIPNESLFFNRAGNQMNLNDVQETADGYTITYSPTTDPDYVYDVSSEIVHRLTTENTVYYSNRLNVTIRDPVFSAIDLSATGLQKGLPSIFTANVNTWNPLVNGNLTGPDAIGYWTLDYTLVSNVQSLSGPYNTIFSHTFNDTLAHDISFTLINRGTTVKAWRTYPITLGPDVGVTAFVTPYASDSKGRSLRYDTGSILIDSGASLDISATFAGQFAGVSGEFLFGSTVTVTNSGSGAYTINGSNNPTLSFIRGRVYIINVNATGHPFWIQTVAGAYSAGNIYNTGIINNGTQNGKIFFEVPLDAPQLYYACQYHSSMAGAITVSTLGSGKLGYGTRMTLSRVAAGFLVDASDSIVYKLTTLNSTYYSDPVSFIFKDPTPEFTLFPGPITSTRFTYDPSGGPFADILGTIKVTLKTSDNYPIIAGDFTGIDLSYNWTFEGNDVTQYSSGLYGTILDYTPADVANHSITYTLVNRSSTIVANEVVIATPIPPISFNEQSAAANSFMGTSNKSLPRPFSVPYGFNSLTYELWGGGGGGGASAIGYTGGGGGGSGGYINGTIYVMTGDMITVNVGLGGPSVSFGGGGGDGSPGGDTILTVTGSINYSDLAGGGGGGNSGSGAMGGTKDGAGGLGGSAVRNDFNNTYDTRPGNDGQNGGLTASGGDGGAGIIPGTRSGSTIFGGGAGGGGSGTPAGSVIGFAADGTSSDGGEGDSGAYIMTFSWVAPPIVFSSFDTRSIPFIITVPPGCFSVTFKLIGAGGGGGGGQIYNSNTMGGTGGGSGAYIFDTKPVCPGEVITILYDASGGLGGGELLNGSPGGQTEISCDFIDFGGPYIAGGGQGGLYGANNIILGGVGGIVSPIGTSGGINGINGTPTPMEEEERFALYSGTSGGSGGGSGGGGGAGSADVGVGGLGANGGQAGSDGTITGGGRGGAGSWEITFN